MMDNIPLGSPLLSRIAPNNAFLGTTTASPLPTFNNRTSDLGKALEREKQAKTAAQGAAAGLPAGAPNPLGLEGNSDGSKYAKYGPFQKDLFRLLYGPGGPLRALLSGAPDAGYEAGVQRGLGQLNQNLASQGIYGSGLAAKASANYLAGAAQGREENRLQTLLQAAQPFGLIPKSGSSGGGGILGILGL